METFAAAARQLGVGSRSGAHGAVGVWICGGCSGSETAKKALKCPAVSQPKVLKVRVLRQICVGQLRP